MVVGQKKCSWVPGSGVVAKQHRCRTAVQLCIAPVNSESCTPENYRAEESRLNACHGAKEEGTDS